MLHCCTDNRGKMRITTNFQRGFTIVELLVVIVVIGILAGIGIVSYGSWQNSIRQSAVKSDILAASSAMEGERGFNNAYPLVLPASFVANENVTITLSSASTTTYCIDGVSTIDNTVTYYLDSRAREAGPQSGTCATRPNLTPPVAPASVTIVASTGSSATVNWPYVPDATSYTVQCASDAAFIYGTQQTIVNTTATGTISGVVGDLTPSSMFYCRVKSSNTKGASAWSGSGSSETDDSFNALAVATSVDGYWSTAPTGFLIEDGSAVSRDTYSDLFAIIGTTYGVGDGVNTFNLPDSRGRTAVNRNTSDAEFATIGQETGSKTESLTIAQMPSHTHIQNAHDHNAGMANPYVAANSPGISVPAQVGSAFGFRYNPSAPSPSTTAVNQTSGSGSAHNNIQPSIVKLSVIKFAKPDTAARTLPAGTSINGYWSTAPSGYLLEDGTAVSRITYGALFSAIGTTYGAGDGVNTFNLPDSRGRAGVTISASDSEFNSLGEKPGSKREQLTIAQIPSHTHVQTAHNHNGGAPNPYVSDSSLGGISVSSQAGGSFGYYLRAGQPATATNQSTGGDADHNNIQPSIVKLAAIKFTTESGSSGVPVAPGTSVGGYWINTPTGYLAEDGSAVSRTTYSDLFNAIGTTYGAGDGSSTFNLPDSRGRVGVNKNTADSEFNTMGEKYGTKTHTLTIAQMASHTHIQNAHDHNGAGMVYLSDGSFGGNATTTQNGTSYGFTLISQPLVAAVNQNTGGGGSHNEIQPSIVKRFVIRF